MVCVVQAFFRLRRPCCQILREHIKMHGMEDLFGEVLVPTEEVVEMRAGQKRKVSANFPWLRPGSDGDG